MWQSHGPQFRCWSKNIYEPFAITGSNFRAERDSYKIGMSVVAKLAVEVFAWCNKQWLKEISGLHDVFSAYHLIQMSKRV
jgi:hypothetical protein